ncbi:MAG TPA: tetratricopeptide repeat protein [Terracidiphilus sp.]|nr:tetratricopeptide repeat protein [Terracidiphilus sp.]
MRRHLQSAVLAATLWLLFQSGVGNVHALESPSKTTIALEERALLLAAKREPRNVEVVGALGEYYLHKEEWRESVRWLARAAALSAQDESIGYDLAFAYMQAGELDSAQHQIRQMLAQADSAKLHNLLAAVKERGGDNDGAVREYYRAAEVEPTESNIFDLATFLLQHKQYVGWLDESVKYFRYGVEKYPRSSQMMVGLGVALYASEQYDEAVRVLCAAVDLDPKDPRPVQFLGRAGRVSPDLATAVDKRLKDFADRYPDNAATNYFYALSLWERGGRDEGRNFPKIQELLRKAEALSPGWYEPHYQLGLLYEAEKRYPDAIREMQKAVKIDPNFFSAHFRLVTLYGRIGDKPKALDEAQKVKHLKQIDDANEIVHDVSR